MTEQQTALNTAKRAAFEALLPYCPYVHFMPKVTGTAIPPPGHDRALETYRYGRTATIMYIPDLVVSDDGLAGTMSMRGMLQATFVPWSAVAFITVNGADGELLASLSFAIELAAPEAEKPKPADEKTGSNVIQFKPRKRTQEVRSDEKEGA